MANITIFGKGNMGQAIGGLFTASHNAVTYLDSNDPVNDLGDIVVLAVPYPAAISIAKAQVAKLSGKIVVDITNPLNFETWDELVVPADSSAAAQLAALLPDSQIVKGFNTTFAGTLNAKQVGGQAQTTVLLASDGDEAKQQVAAALTDSGVAVVDAGALKRARELEALGFLQMTLAAKEKISWNGGFALLK